MDELARIRIEYDRRARDARYRNWYSAFNPANIFIVQERDREMARLLATYLGQPLSTCRILDLGCGSGHELAKFIGLGAKSERLFGLDLLWDRVQSARHRFAHLRFQCGNAEALPYPNHTFDLISQFTVFTSILDEGLRQRMAAEMLRVLKPQGLVLWYDYRLNPTNPHTRGIERAEIKRLFPHCQYDFRRVTLAPPLARLVAPHSWFLCALLNQFPFLRTHDLVVIRRRSNEASF